MATVDVIKKATTQLFPNGRAFRRKVGGDLEKLSAALSESEARTVDDIKGLLFTILPDNSNFDDDDATDWEIRLGLPISSASLEVRKQAIIRKMNHPGTIPARQHPEYIQGQLQDAGFDVYVHENLNPTISPIAFAVQPYAGYANMGNYNMGQVNMASPTSIATGLTTAKVNMGMFNMGQKNMGIFYTNKVANQVVAEEDYGFNYGGSFKSSFFIGAETAGEFAEVDADRETEFRQLILKLKPANTIAFIFIDYV